MKQTSRFVILVGVVTFVVGMGCGLLGLRAVVQHRLAHGKIYGRILQRLNAKLDLTPEQQTHVAEVLSQTREQVQGLRAEVQPKFKAIRDEAVREIRGTLTLEQQQRFDRIQARWQSHLALLRARYLSQ